MLSAPVLFVKGRQHDVQVLYAETSPSDYVEATLKTIFQIHLKRPPGDILVFLPGEFAGQGDRHGAASCSQAPSLCRPGRH